MTEVGKRYGRLVVLAPAPTGKNWLRRWTCRCDCGTEKAIFQSSLRHGNTQSCGCLQRERTSVAARAANRKHGHAGGNAQSPEYMAWVSMHQRCSNPSSASYVDYGARGIRVCERWASFESFLHDMGPRPSGEHSIDRVDNDGGYSPDNCRWATRVQQTRNTRRSVWITLHGERRSLMDWADTVGLPPSVIRRRVRRGWDPARALSEPPKASRKAA